MRLITVFSWILVYLTAWAEASALAGPYQTVYIWIAFQLDIEAYNADPANWKRTIAPGLSTTASFDDFLKYISKNPGQVKPTGLSAADVDINTIDVVKVADTLKTVGYPNTTDLEFLLPDVYQRLNGQNPKFHETFDPLFQTVANAYKALGKTPQVTTAIAKATACWSAVIPGRIAENQPGIIKAMTLLIGSAQFRSYNLQLSTYPRNGNTYIDFATTLKSASPTPSALAVSMFKNFEQGNYDSLLKQLGSGQKSLIDAVKKARSHANTIANSQKYLSKFRSMC